MTLITLNGGAPNYTGFEFNNTISLLNEIKSTLESAGWSTVTDEITASSSLLMRTAVNNTHYTWVKFTVTTNGSINNGKYLNIFGDLDGTNTTLSPNTLQLEFVESAPNYLWITTDEHGGCLCLRSFGAASGGIHFGFLDRFDSSDEFAVMIGYLWTLFRNAYSAKLYYNSSLTWRQLAEDFYKGTTLDSSNTGAKAYTHGIIDRFTTVASADACLNTAASVPQYYYFKGKQSPIINLPILSDYFHIEGKGNSNLYGNTDGTEIPPDLFCRGIVKYAVTGLASLSTQAQAIDSAGNRYLSVGSQSWQGMQIHFV
jgi:hypothetical protein